MKTTSTFLLLLIFILAIAYGQTPQVYYISPTGNDNALGTSQDAPIKSIEKGFDKAQPGDTLFLLPGIHAARTQIEDKHGSPNKPIVLISHAKDPGEFAVIDADVKATTENGDEGLVLKNSSWINIENIIFRNCWASVILIRESNYISIRSCHFSTGKRIVHAIGHKTHHILVENCHTEHPEEVWRGWSWESIHHGTLSYYNGALLHPNKSGGGHIMRENTLINVFNAFRTRPISIQEDGNTEVYSNKLSHIRDNEYEPETWAWNMHYYYNEHVNIHKMYSIDGVKGGNIYIYGNTYTQTKDPWAIEEVSGIFKYSAYEDGALTYPCYAFNNSYYTEAEVLRRGESTNHHLKHFNNAYFFFEGDKRFHLKAWQKGYEFDYDCINQEWPPNITQNDQEKHGLTNTDAGFVDGSAGNFNLKANSASIDAGKPMVLPEFNWTQKFTGSAPDIGAYEGNTLTDGPPFRFIPSPEGAFYQERPRISRHSVKERTLVLNFSAELDKSSVNSEALSVYQQGKKVNIESVSFPNNPFELFIKTSSELSPKLLSINFEELPKGKNGLPLTYWASTISIGNKPRHQQDLSKIPVLRHTEYEVPNYSRASIKIKYNALGDTAIAVVKARNPVSEEFTDRLVIYAQDGNDLAGIYPFQLKPKQVIYKLGTLDYPPGVYQLRVRLGKQVVIKEFTLK